MNLRIVTSTAYLMTATNSSSIVGRIKKRDNSTQKVDALSKTCEARMRDGRRAPRLLRLCAAAFAHRTCTGST